MSSASVAAPAAATNPSSGPAPTTYIQTTTNSFVSRAASIEGPKLVELKVRNSRLEAGILFYLWQRTKHAIAITAMMVVPSPVLLEGLNPISTAGRLSRCP